MNRDRIFNSLPENFPWRTHIHYFDSTESTNTLAKSMAAEGAPHGTVLIADHQTGGRGRMGRSFHSPGGVGIYLSVILRPACPPAKLMHLTCAAAVAMCSAVEQSAGIRPGIKWTNDLVCGSRKIAGVLTEMALDKNGTVSYAIIGVGINCNHRNSDFPPELQQTAASLSMITGRQIHRAKLASSMIIALEQMDRQLFTHQDAMLNSYREDCITLGKDVSIHRGEMITHARALDIDEQGALIVQYPDGRRETVNSGEVSVRGMYGYV